MIMTENPKQHSLLMSHIQYAYSFIPIQSAYSLHSLTNPKQQSWDYKSNTCKHNQGDRKIAQQNLQNNQKPNNNFIVHQPSSHKTFSKKRTNSSKLVHKVSNQQPTRQKTDSASFIRNGATRHQQRSQATTSRKDTSYVQTGLNIIEYEPVTNNITTLRIREKEERYKVFFFSLFPF